METKICPFCDAENELGGVYCIQCGNEVRPWQWVRRPKEPQMVNTQEVNPGVQSQEAVQKGWRQVPDAFDFGYISETGLVWDKYSMVWLIITAVIGFASISAISDQNFKGFLGGLGLTVVSALYTKYLIEGGKFRIIFF